MPPLKFRRVVSFSSEDPQHPATGLLARVREVGREWSMEAWGIAPEVERIFLHQGKWTCRDEGEKEAWVVLQLEETSVITDVDLGNFGAAFIEVQVRRQKGRRNKLSN